MRRERFEKYRKFDENIKHDLNCFSFYLDFLGQEENGIFRNQRQNSRANRNCFYNDCKKTNDKEVKFTLFSFNANFFKANPFKTIYTSIIN